MRSVRFLRLELQGFKSFARPVTFRLDRPDGLYLMGGVNEVEPQLGGNGAGKSSLWDGLCWALYGKSARGVKAGALSYRHEGKGYRAKLDLEVSGTAHTLVRHWTPNKLLLDGKPVEQETVDSLVGLAYEAFLSTVLFGQFRPVFADLRPAEKERFFSEVLDLDRWISFSKVASGREKAEDAELRQLEVELGEASGELNGIRQEEAKLDSERWESERQARIARLEASLESGRKQLAELDAQRTELVRYLAVRRKELKGYESRMEDLEAGLARAKRKQRGLDREVGKVSVILESAQERLEKLARMGPGATCTLCGQSVGAQALSEEKILASRRVRTATGQKSSLERAWNVLENTLDELEVHIRQVRELKASARESVVSRTGQLERVEAQITELRRKVEKELPEEVKLERDTENPLRTRYLKLVELVRRLTLRQSRLSVRAWERKRNRDGYGYWIKGFREIRLMLVSRALSQLRGEVELALESLGLGAWRIEFGVEKSGFDVTVTNAEGKAAPWEAWSGGEVQRLRLAISMGMAGVISSLRGVRYNLEIWDEPTAWLSASGIDSLLDSLYYRARNRHNCVWLTDHRVLEYGGFAGTAVVVKGPEGSYLMEGQQ